MNALELDFKYKSRFDFPIKTVYASTQGKFLSLASLEELKKLAPDEAHIRTNYDLLYNAFNAAVINRINKNEDGIDSATAVAIYKNFVHKPMNIEHNRNLIVGHIINAGFSEFITNVSYTEAMAASSNVPYYLNLSAVVYKLADIELANLLIEASDETSPNYKRISASWELGFNSYHILLGHKDLAEGELVTDPKQVEAFSKYLKINSGEGKLDDGTPVYRVISGEVLPLGCGYTTAPAAEVEGVLVLDNNKIEASASIEVKSEETETTEIVNRLKKVDETFEQSAANLGEAINNLAENTQKIEENKNISSQENINTVKIHSIMKFTKLEDITDESLQQASAATLKQFLAEEIDKATVDYGAKLDKINQDLEAEKQAKATEKTNFDKVQQELDKVKAELDKEQTARMAEKAQADFNARMSDLNEKYNLNDKDRAAVAKRIKGMSDDDYSLWFNDEFSVLAELKSKAIANQQAQNIEQVLDNAKPNTQQASIPDSPTPSKKAEWAEAFKLEDIVRSKR